MIMLKKRGFIVFSVIIVLFLISQIAFAQSINEPETKAGLMPDSWLYGLDVAIDKISLLLTFDNSLKAKNGLEIARERLLEVKEMIEENKFKAAEISQNEHTNTLKIVKSAVVNIEKASSMQEIEEEIEIEKELEEHKTEIEIIKGELKVKIEIKGEITQEQKTLIDSILTSLENKTGEVEIEIENKKIKTKIEIEIETGKSEEEIEEEIEVLEDIKGLTEIRKEKALDKINEAEKKINKTIEKLNRLNISNGNISFALNLLAQAKEAYASENYKEAIILAKQAKKQISEYKELFEDLEELEEEIEIEVEIEEGIAKVKIEVNDSEFKFSLETTNKEEIIFEIINRTSLTREQVEENIKFKIEEKEKAETNESEEEEE